jgi:hypothetical protein
MATGSFSIPAPSISMRVAIDSDEPVIDADGRAIGFDGGGSLSPGLGSTQAV